MDVSLSNEFHMRMEYAREDMIDVEQQLLATRNDITVVTDAAEQLTAEVGALGLQREQLEKDEASLAQSEAIAADNKVLAEKKLMDVGGYECVVRILRDTLQKAKVEIMDTKDETKALIHEELQLRAKFADMTQSLIATRQDIARLQKECAAAVDRKREADDKLHQLSLFLNHALSSSLSSNTIRPASPTSTSR